MSADRFAKQSAAAMSTGGGGIDTDATSLSFGQEFAEAHCLLTSEVAVLLQDLQQARMEEARRGPVPPPSKAFTDTMEHAISFGQYDNRELLRSIRQTLMHVPGLCEFEIAQLANLAPSTVDEAHQLIPSLVTSLDDSTLQKIVNDLSSIRRYQM